MALSSIHNKTAERLLSDVSVGSATGRSDRCVNDLDMQGSLAGAADILSST
ncbi:hypothetical protein O999_19170 [Pseudomonas putida LF54]|nr:hypothetical protein O999_19170 [Pseudomonas putida LF54]